MIGLGLVAKEKSLRKKDSIQPGRTKELMGKIVKDHEKVALLIPMLKGLFSLKLFLFLDKEEVTYLPSVAVKEEASGFGKVASFPEKDLNQNLKARTKMTMQLRNNHSSTQFVRIHQ